MLGYKQKRKMQFTYTVGVNVADFWLPDHRDKLGDGTPNIIGFGGNEIVKDKRCNLSNDSKVTPGERKTVLYKGMPVQGRDTKTRGVKG